MHANTLLVAVMASVAAAQIDVVHVLETLKVVPSGAQNARAGALRARQDDAECQSSLSEILTDMPTLPSGLLDYAQTAPEPTDVCVRTLPASLSAPLLGAFTSFARWGFENSNDYMEWSEKCDYNMEQAPSIQNPGGLFMQDCTTANATIYFTDARTTSSIQMNSVLVEIQSELFSSLSSRSLAGETGAATTSSEASETGSSTASEDAAESSGVAGSDEGDDGSGASNVVASAAVVGLAAVAGFFIAI